MHSAHVHIKVYNAFLNEDVCIQFAPLLLFVDSQCLSVCVYVGHHV